MAITTPCDPKEELIKTLAEQVLWGCENNRFICKYDVEIDIAIYAYSHIHTHAHTHTPTPTPTPTRTRTRTRTRYVCVYIYIYAAFGVLPLENVRFQLQSDKWLGWPTSLNWDHLPW